MNYCGACGEQVRVGSIYCEACGAPMLVAAGAEATREYTIPTPASRPVERARLARPDPWKRPSPVPPPSVAPARLPDERMPKRGWQAPVAAGLALLFLVTTIALGFGFGQSRSQLAASRHSVTRLTNQARDLRGIVTSDQSQISGLQSDVSRLHGAVQSCQRSAGIMARAWDLTSQARASTIKAAGAVLIGDYLDAAYFVQRGNGLMRQSRGLIVGASDDLKACANSTGGGGSNSAV